MGWAGGNDVFDPVARTLIELGTDDSAKTQICSVLIDGLQDRGWDTESESLGQVADDPAIVAAFRERASSSSATPSTPRGPGSARRNRSTPATTRTTTAGRGRAQSLRTPRRKQVVAGNDLCAPVRLLRVRGHSHVASAGEPPFG
jgi:hypothetical protein